MDTEVVVTVETPVVVIGDATVWVRNTETVVGGGPGAVDTDVAVTATTLVVVLMEAPTVWVTNTETVVGGSPGAVDTDVVVTVETLVVVTVAVTVCGTGVGAGRRTPCRSRCSFDDVYSAEVEILSLARWYSYFEKMGTSR